MTKTFMDWLAEHDPEMHEGLGQWAMQKAMPLAAGAAATMGSMFGGNMMPQAQAAERPAAVSHADFPDRPDDAVVAKAKMVSKDIWEVGNGWYVVQHTAPISKIGGGYEAAKIGAQRKLMQYHKVDKATIRGTETIEAQKSPDNKTVTVKVLMLLEK
jgi:hypothetical protein